MNAHTQGAWPGSAQRAALIAMPVNELRHT
jgi:hypothetical protein